MFAGAFTRGKSAAIQTFGTDAQKVLVSLLFEDRVQIISTFDMNKVASLTYSDDVRDELFDVFRCVLLAWDVGGLLGRRSLCLWLPFVLGSLVTNNANKILNRKTCSSKAKF